MKLLTIFLVILCSVSEVLLQPVETPLKAEDIPQCESYYLPNQIGVCVSITCPLDTARVKGSGCVPLSCPPGFQKGGGACVPICQKDPNECPHLGIAAQVRCNEIYKLDGKSICREDENHVTQPKQ